MVPDCARLEFHYRMKKFTDLGIWRGEALWKILEFFQIQKIQQRQMSFPLSGLYCESDRGSKFCLTSKIMRHELSRLLHVISLSLTLYDAFKHSNAQTQPFPLYL